MCKVFNLYKDKLKYRVWRWRNKAKSRGLKWEVDIEYIKKLLKMQKGKCFYTKKELSYEPHSEYLISLDRIDSSKGYTKGNVRLVCWDANNMKSNYKHSKFIRICNVISKIHPKKVKVDA